MGLVATELVVVWFFWPGLVLFPQVVNLIPDSLWNFEQHEKLVMSTGGDEKRRIGGGPDISLRCFQKVRSC